jgi:3-methylfumaryl-CoA hydratase
MAQKTTSDVAADYIGRQRVEQDEIATSLCRRLAALLDREPATVRAGDELPLGWSAILFPSIARQCELGEDGHPKRGQFLPPVPLPRRMFAGREVVLHQPLHIGEQVQQCSTIEAIVPKHGRSGALVFVTIRHEITGPAGLAVTERQRVVYRENGDGAAGPTNTVPALPDTAWHESFVADPVSLFRYSALTFNGHRIHYDQDYAARVEGYPALVVNGGYTTLRLLEFFRAHCARPVASYAVRAIRPLFAGRIVTLRGAPTAEGAAVWASDEHDVPALKIDLRTLA